MQMNVIRHGIYPIIYIYIYMKLYIHIDIYIYMYDDMCAHIIHIVTGNVVSNIIYYQNQGIKGLQQIRGNVLRNPLQNYVADEYYGFLYVGLNVERSLHRCLLNCQYSLQHVCHMFPAHAASFRGTIQALAPDQHSRCHSDIGTGSSLQHTTQFPASLCHQRCEAPAMGRPKQSQKNKNQQENKQNKKSTKQSKNKATINLIKYMLIYFNIFIYIYMSIYVQYIFKYF